MKYPPFDIAIRLTHNVRYVKGWLIKRPLCIVRYVSGQGWKLGCNTKSIPGLPANISHNTQGALDEPPLDVSNVMD
ncbi:hypothetical protein DSO57_1035052 [Entomophthora muscae]|uniref:Uncharacterized protein n=1 Tax=Entomophthora muscae TaxID=34485 RepID=A0ACC2UKE0_9FUNG|nr:hypothetical protein DSO57_1035052 [Entomophthora muscae]